ncbi:FAD/NAD(P)-binding domain-containing protein [Paraphaeosphaeria sporulosa]|uniref:FAD/NAD(P)-binding domain-containing protein n=1 Tax=Paraphaeosphaeria sporulosa TaxID=1460663 RepID=A0A177BUZ0_9PLEO|nr:FAD/NAD(P)-binding domain-containing protein [Paraphaeosphaeria sporulosa]OAF98541.1 FAD/NAD(P)-binding domain-containing protein [Paraphaeosphaeria sporulosa]
MTEQTPAANLVASGQDYEDESVHGVDALQVQQRYGEEAAKRMRQDGNSQFVDVSLDGKFASFLSDPWVEKDMVKDVRAMFPNNECQVLILGAGFGGLLSAIRMVEVGIRPEDIRILDIAGGFGGTWYWNRYPGLSCDIESYCYLPLLEETGYIPHHRYSQGEEIREYANLLAKKWGISDSAVFQTQAQKLVWDEKSKEWQVKLTQQRSGEEPRIIDVHAQFVVASNGVLNWPKLPGVPGILEYQGDIFHSSRWNYALTGGSPSDPLLTKLEGKRVAIVGTGATAIQIVPELARWAKHVYVVQRTPASVSDRQQRTTDEEWFRSNVATSKGWQRERLRNFHQHFTLDQPPSTNLCDDGWTRAPALVGLAGNPAGPQSMEEIPAYMGKLHEVDLPRQQALRSHVESVVNDAAVAEKLKAWYPSWCKRPLFHDEYLSTFNRSNVTLVDTVGKGLDKITVDSIVVGDQTYPVDIIIFATGFRAPFIGSPAEKANVSIVGRDGKSMSEEWAREGPSTLHGVLDANFPNLFLSGPWQASNSPNYLFNLDFLAKHSAHILGDAKRQAEGKRFVVSVTKEATDAWGMQVLMHSFPGAAILGCTPGYFNVEGELARAPPERQMVIARSGVWGHGIESFCREVEAWYEKSNMHGIEVQTVL